LDDFVHVPLEKGFRIALFSGLKETENTFLEKGFHFSLGKFGFVGIFAGLLEVSTNEYSFVQSQFLRGSFEHLSLISVAGDESVDLHFTLLSDSVGSGCGLHIVLGVPVRVIDDDNIGRGEVDADSSCLGGEEEDISLLGWVVVSVDGSLSLLGLDLTINSFVAVVLALEELLNQLQHVSELREDQYLLALVFALLQQFLH
jgi:hypothetical protein